MNQWVFLLGNLMGSAVSFSGTGKLVGSATKMMTGSTALARIAAGSVPLAAQSGISTAAQGGTAQDIILSALKGGVIGAISMGLSSVAGNVIGRVFANAPAAAYQAASAFVFALSDQAINLGERVLSGENIDWAQMGTDMVRDIIFNLVLEAGGRLTESGYAGAAEADTATGINKGTKTGSNAKPDTVLGDAMTELNRVYDKVLKRNKNVNAKIADVDGANNMYMDAASGKLDAGTSAMKMASTIDEMTTSGLLKPKETARLNEIRGQIENAVETGGWTGYNNGTNDITVLLKKTTCSTDDLLRYLNKLNGDYAETFSRTGEWPKGEQIPKSAEVLNEDGSVNWALSPEGGYVLDSNGNAIKESYIPKKGEIIDRYGPSDGRYTSPVEDGKPYDHDQRSTPYVEDASMYNQYEVVGDFSKLYENVSGGYNSELKTKILAYVNRYYNGDFSKIVVYKGRIAKAFGSTGGGVQYELPMPIEWLEQIGLLKKIN